MMTHDQQEAMKVLKAFIRTDEYKNSVRERIDLENAKFEARARSAEITSLKPMPDFNI